MALVEWSQSIKQIILFALIVNIFIPWGIASSVTPFAIGAGLLIFVIKVATLAVGIAFLESSVAKWRLFRLPDLIAIAVASSMIGLVFYYL